MPFISQLCRRQVLPRNSCILNPSSNHFTPFIPIHSSPCWCNYSESPLYELKAHSLFKHFHLSASVTYALYIYTCAVHTLPHCISCHVCTYMNFLLIFFHIPRIFIFKCFPIEQNMERCLIWKKEEENQLNLKYMEQIYSQFLSPGILLSLQILMSATRPAPVTYISLIKKE